jgi:hypothetical protein
MFIAWAGSQTAHGPWQAKTRTDPVVHRVYSAAEYKLTLITYYFIETVSVLDLSDEEKLVNCSKSLIQILQNRVARISLVIGI